jgi:hypothetical protein
LVSLANAISGNPEISAFLTKYLHDERIAGVIMTEHEKALIKTLLSASEGLRHTD